MRRVLLGVVGGIALLAPAPAMAAGGPPPPAQDGAAVTAPGTDVSFATRGMAGGDTLVQQVRADGSVGRTRVLGGAYGIPTAAFDGSTTGLSANGGTLVLAEIVEKVPVRRTRLVVLRGHDLRVARRTSLPGWWTVDAISPSGDSLFLIRYLSDDGTRYDVRAYDLVRGRLWPEPIVDVREPDEKMQGVPITRTMSADGRWAYTLYSPPSGEPFIHALDTAARAAACIDLPLLAGRDIAPARLVAPRGDAPLRVEGAGLTTVAVDVARRTAREVAAPAVAAPPPVVGPDAAPADDDAGLLPALLALVALAALGGGLLLTARRRRRPGSAAA